MNSRTRAARAGLAVAAALAFVADAHAQGSDGGSRGMVSGASNKGSSFGSTTRSSYGSRVSSSGGSQFGSNGTSIWSEADQTGANIPVVTAPESPLATTGTAALTTTSQAQFDAILSLGQDEAASQLGQMNSGERAAFEAYCRSTVGDSDEQRGPDQRCDLAGSQ